MKISASGEYAVRIVAEIAKQNNFVSLKDVAQKENISIKFAEKIASKLVKSNVLTSLRGFDGGYKLTKPATETSIGEILQATGDLLKSVECFKQGCPHIDSCTNISIWQRLNGLMNDYLDSVPISTLIDKNLNIK